jgi:hypothetical protein
MDCCNKEHDTPHNIDLIGSFPALTVGKCAWTFNEFFFVPDWDELTATTQLGTYSLQW